MTNAKWFPAPFSSYAEYQAAMADSAGFMRAQARRRAPRKPWEGHKGPPAYHRTPTWRRVWRACWIGLRFW